MATLKIYVDTERDYTSFECPHCGNEDVILGNGETPIHCYHCEELFPFDIEMLLMSDIVRKMFHYGPAYRHKFRRIIGGFTQTI